MFPSEDTLIQAWSFDKHFNVCDEYEDAYVFRNTRKRPGDYNPVVLTKDGDAKPFEFYKPTKFICSHDVKAAIKALND
ncbi:MAG: hypothetical protein IJ083_10875 [Clostridia bacterium]|nr:hypothetical protein [Clostridia bacterium]